MTNQTQGSLIRNVGDVVYDPMLSYVNKGSYQELIQTSRNEMFTPNEMIKIRRYLDNFDRYESLLKEHYPDKMIKIRRYLDNFDRYESLLKEHYPEDFL